MKMSWKSLVGVSMLMITLNQKFIWYFKLTIVMSLFFIPTSAIGYDITDKFSIGGILAGAYQYQWVNGDDDKGRGAVPFEPEISFRSTANDEIFAKFGFATDYVDENAYANDGFTQFMNEALVNGPNGFAPSYDIGGAVEWEIGIWEFTAVGMNVGENDDGNNFFGR